MGGCGVEEWWVSDGYDAGDDATWDGAGFKCNGNVGSLKDVAIYIRPYISASELLIEPWVTQHAGR